MTPFQFAKIQKIRDFKVDFGNLSGALLPDSLKGRGYRAPLQTSPASAFWRLTQDLRSLHLSCLEIKPIFEMHCLILWSGAATVDAVLYLKWSGQGELSQWPGRDDATTNIGVGRVRYQTISVSQGDPFRYLSISVPHETRCRVWDHHQSRFGTTSSVPPRRLRYQVTAPSTRSIISIFIAIEQS